MEHVGLLLSGLDPVWRRLRRKRQQAYVVFISCSALLLVSLHFLSPSSNDTLHMTSSLHLESQQEAAMVKPVSEPRESRPRRGNHPSAQMSWRGASQYKKDARDEGQAVKVIISGYYRSGSTLTGALLASVPSTFYLYELSRTYYIDWLYAMTSLDSTSYSDVTNRQHESLVSNHLINMLNCDMSHLPVELLINFFHFSFGGPSMGEYIQCVASKQLIKAYAACQRIIEPMCSMAEVGENTTLLQACFTAKRQAVVSRQAGQTRDRPRHHRAQHKTHSVDTLDHHLPPVLNEGQVAIDQGQGHGQGVLENRVDDVLNNTVKGQFIDKDFIMKQVRVNTSDYYPTLTEKNNLADTDKTAEHEPIVEGQGHSVTSIDKQNDAINWYDASNITGSLGDGETHLNNAIWLAEAGSNQRATQIGQSEIENSVLRNNSAMASGQVQGDRLVIVDREAFNMAAESVLTTTSTYDTHNHAVRQLSQSADVHEFNSRPNNDSHVHRSIHPAGPARSHPWLPGNVLQRRKAQSGGQGWRGGQVTEKELARVFSKHAQCVQPIDSAIQACVPLMQAACQRAPVRLVKEVRLDLRVLPSLLARDPTVKVIHLVRDPRGQIILGHRLHTISRICTRMLRDLHMARVVEKQYPGSVLLMRYEDLVFLPLDTARAFYEHVGVEGAVYHAAWLNKTSNPVGNSGVQGTYRTEPAAEAYDWRTLMPRWAQRHVLNIPTCAQVIDELGYPRT